jgi:hypothetical protein
MAYVDPYFAEIHGDALGLRTTAERARNLQSRDRRRARYKGKVTPRRTK